MRFFIAALLAGISVSALASPSDLDSGNDYYSLYQTWQNDSSNKVDQRVAKSMLYAHTKATINAYTDMGDFCPPKGSTYGQAIDIIAEYLKKNPETRNEDISFISFKALYPSFECKDKPSSKQ